MATLNEIAYNIKNLAYNGDTNEEENIGIRQIKFWIHYHRAKIIKELAREGKGIPQECLQRYVFDEDEHYQYQNNSDFYTYVSALTNYQSRDLVASSKRTLDLANAGGAGIYTSEFYGNDYYPQDRGGQADEMGQIILILPEILNIDGYGVKNLKINRRKATIAGAGHNVNHIDIPITDKTISVRHGYSRFGKKSITSYIENSASQQLLVIRNLQSVYRQSNQQDDIGEPILYRATANLLLSNPTDYKQWNNDDDMYPFPDYLVSDLTREVMQEMQIALNTQPDMVTDGYDTTRAQVQQRAQR
jgi:hypothetical protein